MQHNSVTTRYVSCDLCGSDDHELLYSQQDWVTGQTYNLVQCECGMAFVNPMPLEECIPLLYPSDYHKAKEQLTSRYDRMLKLLPSQKGRLLDLGCGRGDFIRHASKYGWTVEGVDIIDWREESALPIRVGNFLEMDLPEQTYDVVTAWAVLEHAAKPSAFLKKAVSLLKEDGAFVFLVPNIAAPGMRLTCTHDIPRHLQLFTPQAAKRYLDGLGMEVQRIHFNSDIYTAYPFGLLRYAAYAFWKDRFRCNLYENRSVALLRGRQIEGNLAAWLTEVRRTLSSFELFIDALDLTLGVTIAKISEWMNNYGIMTIVARRKSIR